ncbi:MAG: type 4a pilus biogenesis protein PilO [Armatimonadota bacterium]
MRSLSPRERLMLAVVISTALATVFYLFVWAPQTARRAELTARLEARQEEVKRLRQLVETREEKEREFARLSERIRLVEVKLPPEREIPRMIRQLQDVAASLGIKLTLLRPGPTQAGPAAVSSTPGQAAVAPAPGAPPAAPRPRYQLFRIDLAFEGTYSDLISYLGRLEDFPRFIVLTQVSITPGELPRLKVTLASNTFVLPKETAPSP